MKTLVAIGEFFRLTHLSVTTLRHYHEVGLLEPTAIDAVSGYRRYDTEQAHTALLIRRLRQLELPAARLAVARHDGCYADSDLTYAALGAYVAEHDTPAAGPIRKIHLISDHTNSPAEYRTEICWPVQLDRKERTDATQL